MLSGRPAKCFSEKTNPLCPEDSTDIVFLRIMSNNQRKNNDKHLDVKIATTKLYPNMPKAPKATFSGMEDFLFFEEPVSRIVLRQNGKSPVLLSLDGQIIKEMKVVGSNLTKFNRDSFFSVQKKERALNFYSVESPFELKKRIELKDFIASMNDVFVSVLSDEVILLGIFDTGDCYLLHKEKVFKKFTKLLNNSTTWQHIVPSKMMCNTFIFNGEEQDSGVFELVICDYEKDTIEQRITRDTVIAYQIKTIYDRIKEEEIVIVVEGFDFAFCIFRITREKSDREGFIKKVKTDRGVAVCNDILVLENKYFIVGNSGGEIGIYNLESSQWLLKFKSIQKKEESEKGIAINEIFPVSVKSGSVKILCRVSALESYIVEIFGLEIEVKRDEKFDMEDRNERVGFLLNDIDSFTASKDEKRKMYLKIVLPNIKIKHALRVLFI